MHRALVIEDDDALRRVLTRLLEREYTVDAVGSAEDAVCFLKSGRWYDAIVCDIALPGFSGLELVDSTSVMSFAQSRRVVFVTGHLNARTTRPCIVKPFRGIELLAKVREIAHTAHARPSILASCAAADTPRAPTKSVRPPVALFSAKTPRA